MKKKKKQDKRTKPTGRAAAKPDVVAELKKMSEERLREVAGGQAEFLCVLGYCY